MPRFVIPPSAATAPIGSLFGAYNDQLRPVDKATWERLGPDGKAFTLTHRWEGKRKQFTGRVTRVWRCESCGRLFNYDPTHQCACGCGEIEVRWMTARRGCVPVTTVTLRGASAVSAPGLSRFDGLSVRTTSQFRAGAGAIRA